MWSMRRKYQLIAREMGVSDSTFRNWMRESAVASRDCENMDSKSEVLGDLHPAVAEAFRRALEQCRVAGSQLGPRLAYTEAEAAELLGLKKHQLRDARYRGEVAAVRRGKSYLYSADELRRFVTPD